ncbi:DUF1120 domain-containing protein [Pseudomonas graminis]
MNKTLTPLLAVSLLCSSATAAEVDLAVRGRITPNACQLQLADGGVVDHGKMAAKDLNRDEVTVLDQYRRQLSVRCEGPTYLALSTVDNRAGSALVPSLHGLGLINGSEKLGSLAFSLANPVSESGPMRPIVSGNNGATWNTGSAVTHGVLTSITYADNPRHTPVAITTLDAQLVFYTYIAPSSTLTLTEEVPLDGDVTLEMKYL